MTTLARKVLNQNSEDNMTLDRIVSKSGWQDIFPVQMDQDYKKGNTAYIFEDGSALINNSDDQWYVKTNYGLHCDNQEY